MVVEITEEEYRLCRDKLLVIKAKELKEKVAWIKLAKRNGKIFLWFKEDTDAIGLKALVEMNCPLSYRELQVVNLISQGNTNITIGRSLGLHPSTIKSHLARMYKKLNIKALADNSGNRTLLVTTCFRNGWIE